MGCTSPYVRLDYRLFTKTRKPLYQSVVFFLLNYFTIYELGLGGSVSCSVLISDGEPYILQPVLLVCCIDQASTASPSMPTG